MKIYFVCYYDAYSDRWLDLFMTATSKAKIIAAIKKIRPAAQKFKVVIAGDA